MLKFETMATDVQNRWYVYKINNKLGLQYIGFVDGRNLLLLSDAMTNPYIKKRLVAEPHLTVEVLSVHRTRPEANAAMVALVTEHRPPLNQFGRAVLRREKPVVCIETGVRFPSIGAAATFAGVALQSMSNHLYRRRGYNRIRGNQYECTYKLFSPWHS